jgi:hypothetical protein
VTLTLNLINYGILGPSGTVSFNHKLALPFFMQLDEFAKAQAIMRTRSQQQQVKIIVAKCAVVCVGRSGTL